MMITNSSGALGFAVIVVLYVTIGLLAAVGAATLSQKLFSGRREQVFYGIFLAPIAGFYLAFVGYFGDWGSWRTELVVVFVFSLLGVVGTRYVLALIPGYLLHGTWDALHELSAHCGASVPGLEPLTTIPLAYGVFCATFDVAICVYFVRRKGVWEAAWGRLTDLGRSWQALRS